MKDKNEFKDGVTAYLHHIFPTDSDIKIEYEEGDDLIIVQCQHGEHILELQATNGIHYLTTIIKMKAFPNQNVDDVMNLENTYKYRRINDFIYLGIKDELVTDRYIEYVLEDIIRDYITCIDFFDHGITKLPRFIDNCAFDDLAIRAEEKREQLGDELIKMKMFFTHLTEKGYEEYPDKTKFIFDDYGNFMGLDKECPPSSYRIIKSEKHQQNLNQVIEFLDKVYEKAIKRIEQRLKELINGDDLDDTPTYETKYLQWEGWIVYDYSHRV